MDDLKQKAVTVIFGDDGVLSTICEEFLWIFSGTHSCHVTVSPTGGVLDAGYGECLQCLACTFV